MARDQVKFQQQMNRALDGELAEQEWAVLRAHLQENTEEAARWERLRKTDELLRTTPLVAPSRGFADRVMAAILSMPMPEFVRRSRGLGLALGLLVAALLAVPVLWVALFIFVSVITNPDALAVVLQTVLDAAGYVVSLLNGVVDEARALTSDRALLGGLLAAALGLAVLWVWLIRRTVGGQSALARRSKL
ncbi:MAG: hypothetical protein Kow00106_16040 [Anaerolineae bacterium]